MKLDFEEKKKTVDILQKTMKQQKTSLLRAAELQSVEHKRQMKMQKEQYESTIQRHLSFIDQVGYLLLRGEDKRFSIFRFFAG